MYRHYDSNASRLRFAPLYVKLCVVGAALALLASVPLLMVWVLQNIPDNYFISAYTIQRVALLMSAVGLFTVGIGGALMMTSIFVLRLMPDTARVRHSIRRGLCDPAYGNPLHLKDGELLPTVACEEVGKGIYDIKVTAVSKSVDDLLKLCSILSGYLRGRYGNLAITNKDLSPDCGYVTFRVDDVLADKSITYRSLEDMRPVSPYKLAVQYGTEIDLTTSGSMLVAGKTRGGKTTGIIALLLQILLQGRDNFWSEVMVIDPKQAELSRLSHTLTLDEDGEARVILGALKRFADTIKRRQKILNELSEEEGDAVHWWDAGMHPSVLFIDEYVGLRAILPPKAAKGDDYSLETFDRLVKVIVTTGASAGCYMIISIAQASAGEGGLPTLIKSAMTTRVLFKPSPEEGAFIWDRMSFEAVSRLPAGKQGDAWFSSTDGEHETVSRVHFPRMKFPVYKELGRLLTEYYKD